jgi:hypothetical protein
MKAVRAYETSVYSNETTRRYISEGSNLHNRRRENLKSHIWKKTSSMISCRDTEGTLPMGYATETHSRPLIYLQSRN